MIDIFIPNYDKINEMYFPDGEVINDLAVAEKVNGQMLKQSLEFNGRQSIVQMPQYDDDNVLLQSTVPRSVRTPVEAKQYYKAMLQVEKTRQENLVDKSLKSKMLKYLSS